MANWVKDYLERNPELKDKIHSRGRGSITFEIAPGKYKTECLGAPIHYKDEKSEWQPIDTKFIQIGDEYGTPWSKTRFKTDGSIRIIDDSSVTQHSQKTSQIGLFDPNSKKFTPIITSIPDGVVSGDSIIRTAGKFTHKLTLKETGIREELRIESAGDVVGDTKSYFVIETNFGTTQLFPNGWLDTEFNKAGNIFPLPHAVDTNNEFIPLKRYAKYIDGIQYVYTGILISELSKYTFPLVIDPDYLDMTVDGRIYGGNATYTTARSTSAAYDSGDTTLGHGRNYAGSIYYISRTYLKFDTSGIPDGDTITQVNMKLTPVSAFEIDAGCDFDVQIVKQNWSAQDPLSNTNREAAYDNCLAGTADDSIWRNTSGMVLDTTYTSGNLNTAWVSKTGSTYYSLRSSRDYDNVSFSGKEYCYFASQEHATVAYRPILTVLHASASSIKTILGLAKASVKTVNGLAIASVKTWDGLA